MPRVLIADDDADVVHFLITALEAEGFTTACAPDFAAAADAVRAGGVDLVILDMGVPGVETEAPAQRLREAAERPPRILILTGRDIRRELVRGHLRGADASLEKGCSLDQLLGAVKRLTKKAA